MKIINSRNTI